MTDPNRGKTFPVGETRDEICTNCGKPVSEHYRVSYGIMGLSSLLICPVSVFSAAPPPAPGTVEEAIKALLDNLSECAKAPVDSAAAGPVHGLASDLRRIRWSAGFTLEQLADATGISASQLSRVERGRSAASIETLGRILAALGMAP